MAVRKAEQPLFGQLFHTDENPQYAFNANLTSAISNATYGNAGALLSTSQ